MKRVSQFQLRTELEKNTKMSKWIVINGDQHTAVNSLEEGSTYLDQLLKQNPKAVVKLIPHAEYLKLDTRKRKRGKNS